MKKRRILVVAGGTGGHISPGIAVAEELIRSGHEAFFLTLEKNKKYAGFNDAGFPVFTYNSPPVSLKSAILLPFRWLASMIQAGKIIRNEKIDAVLLMGGYPVVGAALAAWRSKVPVDLCEQNAMPGKANTLLARFARNIYLSFPDKAKRFGKRHVILTGNPVRFHPGIQEETGQKAGQKVRPHHPPGPGRKITLLVVGGSQGAVQISNMVFQLISEYPELAGHFRFQIQTGVNNEQLYKDKFAQLNAGPHIEIFGFSNEMDRRYKEADLLICRSGAGVLTESFMYGIGSILIPYPFAADNHQLYNAKAAEEGGAAYVIGQKSEDPAELARILQSILDDPGQLSRMAESAKNLAKPRAASDVVRFLCMPMNVYLIGIGGSGMLPLAMLAKQSGLTSVSGSDRSIELPYERKLQKNGIVVHRRTNGERLKTGIDAVIYSTAIAENHPEREAANRYAAEGKMDVLHRMDFLRELMAHVDSSRQFALAGTHGKTSSTSLGGWVLLQMGLDPTILLGGQPAYLETGARVGRRHSQTVGIYETDESDGSFLKTEAANRLILNVDKDHLKHYGDFDKLTEAFYSFGLSPAVSNLVINADDARLAKIADRASVSCSINSEPDKTAPVHYSGRWDGKSDRLIFSRNQVEMSGFRLGVPGRHFAGNALLLLAMIAESKVAGDPAAGTFDYRQAIAALESFRGTARRMELVATRHGCDIYDDYGHHPTELKAVLNALRVRYPGKVIAIFEPHRYSRTQELFEAFAVELRAADRLFLMPVFSAGEEPVAGVGSEMIADALIQARGGLSFPPDPVLLTKEQMLDGSFLDQALEGAGEGDAIVCIGAGSISSVLKLALKH